MNSRRPRRPLAFRRRLLLDILEDRRLLASTPNALAEPGVLAADDALASVSNREARLSLGMTAENSIAAGEGEYVPAVLYVDSAAHIFGRNEATSELWMAMSDGSSFRNDYWGNDTRPLRDLLWGDFNADGLTDFAFRGSDNLGVWTIRRSGGDAFWGYSFNQWDPEVTYVDILAADVSGDGRADILGRDQATGEWWVTINGVPNTKTEQWGTYSPAFTWVDVHAADVNGDGMADVVGRQESTGKWAVLRSTGTGFVNETWGAWGVAMVDVQTADVNGDGMADLVGRQESTGNWIVARSTGTSFVNEKWGQWSPEVAWVDVQVADVNGDGMADLVGRRESNGNWLVQRSTGASFVNEKWGEWSHLVTWLDVQVGDFNDDGLADVVGRQQESGKWVVLLSTGASFVKEKWGQWDPAVNWGHVHVGAFTTPWIPPEVPVYPTTQILGIDADTGNVWRTNSYGTAFLPPAWTGNVSTIGGTKYALETLRDLTWGDFSGNGSIDFVYRIESQDSPGNPVWFRSDTIFYYIMTTWDATATWDEILAGDVNGDGREDLLTRDPATGNWWVTRYDDRYWIYNGEYAIEQWGDWSTEVAWVDVQVADVNGDGLADIVGRQESTGKWVVLRSTGTSFVKEKWGEWNPARTWLDVQAADVNGDGLADIVGRQESTGNWMVLRSTGAGFVNEKWGQWNSGVAWRDVQPADVNGDGLMDLVGRRESNGNWLVLRSTGTGFEIEKWGNWNPAVTWVDVLVGDFNDDGLADVVGRQEELGKWVMLQSTGTNFVKETWGQWDPAVNWIHVQAAPGPLAPPPRNIPLAAASQEPQLLDESEANTGITGEGEVSQRGPLSGVPDIGGPDYISDLMGDLLADANRRTLVDAHDAVFAGA